MDKQVILFEQKQGIAYITLNRPESYNAFNTQMGMAFLEMLQRCQEQDDIRVVVLKAAGKAFCSGQDLNEVLEHPRPLGEIVHERYNPMIRLITGMEKPFVCQLQGVAAGAGASLALACDYVVGSEKARLLWAFVNIGLVLDSGSSYLLPRLLGHRKAFELATLGMPVSAREALELGLINQVVQPEQLEDAVTAIAQRYAAAPPKAIGLIKRMLARSFHSSLDEMLELEKTFQQMAGSTADYQEGVKAFLEKRKPAFTGK
ncbi:MAG: 2-(1,2-epoxy-1,2-dihydrophenyl)acetyl-CoA isomerase [Bacteroidetes bacterium]|nr:MAG: 2-(1,2-epoxy-1,2-dihydrophenyl)acetyl-CoA isomerase [Bacteroidota bacterium]